MRGSRVPTRHDRFDGAPLILEHDLRGVAPGNSTDGAAWGRACTRLIQSWNPQAIGREIGPPVVEGVNAATPHGRIHSLYVDRTQQELGETLLFGQIGGMAQVTGENAVGDLLFDRIPMLRPLLESVGQAPFDFQQAIAGRSPGLVEYAGMAHLERIIVDVQLAPGVV